MFERQAVGVTKHAGCPRLFELGRDSGFADHCSEDGRIDALAEDAGRGHHVTDRPIEASDPGHDQAPQLWTVRHQRVDRGGRARQLCGHQADQQRVAARRPVQCVRCVLVGNTGQRRQPRGQLRGGQPAERQCHRRFTPHEIGQDATHRLALVAVGDQHGQPRRAELGGHLAQQQQRRAIGPVQVFEHQQQAGRAGALVQQVGDREEQTEPCCRVGVVGIHRWQFSDAGPSSQTHATMATAEAPPHRRSHTRARRPSRVPRPRQRRLRRVGSCRCPQPR